MNHGIHHINIHTPNLNRLRQFYERAFGFELVFEHYLEDFPEFVSTLTGIDAPAAHVVTMRTKNCFIELFQWSSPEGKPLEPLRPYDFGYTHFAVAVDDIEATHARLVELGMEFVHAPLKVQVNGGEYGSAYGCDPDGNIIELTEIPNGDNMSLGVLGRTAPAE
ncbi:VOC family protein [Streptomyces brasiliensis]|uniref:VOC domain-containing protein n=1 Tax=Streptomyces brasiliensis TaxID=1954 RepID=A0A917UNU5_9ACTN|nr:VOC family protein [Streptomyces brasiliensis]GGJ71141.1 hypothetical protein GCM10010121_097150 [Streptomyces brasiliensis]